MVHRAILGSALAALILLFGLPAATDEPMDFEFLWGAPRARIGVRVQPMTPELREYFGAPEDAGVLVVSVDEGSPADEGGLLVADVILSAGGRRVATPRDLRRAVSRAEVGEPLEIELQRKGKRRTETVKPEESPRQRELREFEDFARGAGRDLQRRVEELERRLRELERALRRELELRLGPHEET
jgi:serine protease Do